MLLCCWFVVFVSAVLTNWWAAGVIPELQLLLFNDGICLLNNEVGFFAKEALYAHSPNSNNNKQRTTNSYGNNNKQQQ